MKEFAKTLAIYLKATVSVFKSGSIMEIKQHNKAMDKRLPKLTIRQLILIEARKSIWKAELDAKRTKLEAEIANTPMSFSNKRGWDYRITYATNNPDHQHDLVVLEYAEAWARLMELRMQQGKSLPEIASDTAAEAYTNDEMLMHCDFKHACRILINFWKYGNELSLCYHD